MLARLASNPGKYYVLLSAGWEATPMRDSLLGHAAWRPQFTSAQPKPSPPMHSGSSPGPTPVLARTCSGTAAPPTPLSAYVSLTVAPSGCVWDKHIFSPPLCVNQVNLSCTCYKLPGCNSYRKKSIVLCSLTIGLRCSQFYSLVTCPGGA